MSRRTEMADRQVKQSDTVITAGLSRLEEDKQSVRNITSHDSDIRVRNDILVHAEKYQIDILLSNSIWTCMDIFDGQQTNNQTDSWTDIQTNIQTDIGTDS